ncbi:EAL domain-containing protein [Alteromonas naphthalenivorans]|uniref:Response regulator receiver modulated diguanylate cyclase/phosphodiesterase with PAS/PAC sensor(S) n=1 Tax=Alteromonas naphthalenivorans TaxID=715451 RepID=F5ZBM5_ALTNA|nr:EAL domain-containing protein [Alteromonas naphthalenivorans]AEF03682.1 response regulator receiver modulated diguanylate cyclase/phosphodiesterase with PAS/PAC sensor(s) [Alteromonas naphthalenivorans]
MDMRAQKVLIVDDEPVNIVIIESAVSSLANVISTSNSLEALHLVQIHKPDLIILDISMPKRSGFDICRAIKADLGLREIPILFVTSFTDSENERKALALGAIDFIAKPIDIEICRMRVKNHLLMQRQKSQLSIYNERVLEEKEQLNITLNAIADGVIATDADGIVTFINPVAQRLTGFNEFEACGRMVDDIMELRDATTNAGVINPALYTMKVKRPVAMAFNVKLVSKQGKECRVEDTASPILDTQGRVKGSVVVFQDVSESVAMAVQMTHVANHDQLTGLPNRVLLHDKIVQSINRTDKAKHSVALLLIDIDNFKYLNDALGHKIGDSIILSISKRLQQACGPSATVARVGGDEFACLLTHVSGLSVDGVAMNCLQSAREPIHIDGQYHQLSLSIGISLFPQDASSAEEMMRHSDTAMYRAKATGKDKFSFFSKDLKLAMRKRVEMEVKLRTALDNNSLAIFFQPKYDLNLNKVVGAESLVRLIDDDGSIVSPDEFIPLSEETGLIHRLGKQVLVKSCEFIAKCVEANEPFKIAVNVSAQQIANPSFAKEVGEVILSTGIDPGLLELEVTESALMADFDQTRNVLLALSSLGLSLALDDFGTGYSSLSYLRQFPLNVLKIDRSFIKDMDTEPQALDIVTAIVRLGNCLNMVLVAEGLETELQFHSLRQLGCEYGQGYYMCKPISEDEFTTRFLNQKTMMT